MKPSSRGSATKSDDHETYTTGEMARLSDTTLRTVRFYEEAGILQPIGRTEGGHRLFEKSQLDRLMLVSDMREAGLSLEEIRTLLDAKAKASSGAGAAQTAVTLLTEKVAGLRTKIDVLSRLTEDLERTIKQASQCLDCKEPQLFPTGCSACSRLTAEPPARGMRVLWGIQSKPQKAAANGVAKSTKDG